jgi:hypothetical protein
MWLLLGWACGGGVETDVTVPPIDLESEGSGTTTPTNTWPQGELTYDDFIEQYPVVYCETWDLCIADLACDTIVAAADELPGCAFDGEAAYACVNGNWVCDEFFPDFPLPLEPEACDEVYDCPYGYDKTP